MAYEFIMRRIVEFSDTDAAGIVHFSTFFRYMEAAEHAMFRAQGLSIHLPLDGGLITFPRVHASADYRSPLRFEDTAEIHVLIRQVTARAMTFDFLIHRAQGDERTLCATGSIVTVAITRQDGAMRSVAIPAIVTEKLTAAPKHAADHFKALSERKRHHA